MAEVRMLKPEPSARSPFAVGCNMHAQLGFVEQAGCSCGFTQVGKDKGEMACATLWPNGPCESQVTAVVSRGWMSRWRAIYGIVTGLMGLRQC